MFRIVVLLSIVTCVLSTAIQPPLNGRIVGGNLTTISEFPYQVSLQRNGKHACGASIYSEDIIVTAAHCLGPIALEKLKIRAGSTFCNNGGLLLDVASYQIHPDYDPNTVINDIGIVRLKQKLQFGATIQPIPLASVEPENGDPAFISGWGVTEFGGNTISTVLQYVSSFAIDSETCRSPSYKYSNKIHSSMICSASPGKDACQNDSGGPMVSGGFLVGVVSWGFRCAVENYPGVYANVAVLRDWVVEAAKTI